jgi:hypothetical protein
MERSRSAARQAIVSACRQPQYQCAGVFADSLLADPPAIFVANKRTDKTTASQWDR